MISIKEILTKLANGSTPEIIFNSHLEVIKEKDSDINAFINVCQFKANDNKGRLHGIPVGIKDALVLNGFDYKTIDGRNLPTTCASKILEDWAPSYNATVCEKIIEQGGMPLGKLNTDEFTMGGSTKTSAFGPSKNPFDLDRVPGGSSGGSASAVASGMCAVALGTDTGGSIRQPASYCGIVGMKPTYGRVSRYGLLAHGSSFDTVGPMTSNVIDNALMMEIISGKDEHDMTTSDLPIGNYVEACDRDIKGMRIAIPKEMMSDAIDQEVREQIEEVANRLRKKGAIVEEITLPYVKYGLAVYYVLIPSEVSANMSRYDGMRFGKRSDGESFKEIFMNTRSKYLGKEVKRRIAMGTFMLSSGYQDAYYNRAKKVRSMIKQDFSNAFKKYDAIISPVAPSVAFRFDENQDPLKMYMEDILTVPASCAQIPAGSVHFAMSKQTKMPVGVQVMANMFQEEKIYTVMAEIERLRD